MKKVIHCINCDQECDIEFHCPICGWRGNSTAILHTESYYEYKCPNCTIVFTDISKFTKGKKNEKIKKNT